VKHSRNISDFFEYVRFVLLNIKRLYINELPVYLLYLKKAVTIS